MTRTAALGELSSSFPRGALLVALVGIVLSAVFAFARHLHDRSEDEGSRLRAAAEAIALFAAIAAVVLSLGELLEWWGDAGGPEVAAGALTVMLGLYLEPLLTARIRRLAPLAAAGARPISFVLIYAVGLAGRSSSVSFSRSPRT